MKERIILLSRKDSKYCLPGGGLDWTLAFPNSLNDKMSLQITRERGAQYSDPQLLQIYAKRYRQHWLINPVFSCRTMADDLRHLFETKNCYKSQYFSVHSLSLNEVLDLPDTDFAYPETKIAISLYQRRKLLGLTRTGYEGTVRAVHSQIDSSWLYETALAVVSIVIYEASSSNIVLIRQNRPGDEGLLSLPGGKIERSSSPNQAIVAEAAEESGVSMFLESILGLYYNGDVNGRPIMNLCYSSQPIGPLRDATGFTNHEVQGIEVLPIKEALQIPDERYRTPDTKCILRDILQSRPTLPLDVVTMLT